MSSNRFFGWLFTVIFVLLGSFYMMRGCAHGIENKFWDDYMRGGEPMAHVECMEKIKFHEKEAKRIYEETRGRIWWLPQLTDREKGRRAFQMIAPAVAAHGWRGKLAAIGLAAFVQYGLDVMDEWEWLEGKWYWFSYHVEMVDFYERYLVHEARMMSLSLLGIHEQD